MNHTARARSCSNPLATIGAVGTLAAAVLSAPAGATWSICLADTETGEVAIGTVTCLNSFDLLAIVPVVVVGEGTGACQSAGDFDGIRRPVIFEQLMLDTPPADILTLLEGIGGHQSRQYGIVDTDGGAITFSGAFNGDYAGGVVGQTGSVVYAVQGNVLTGACVIDGIEQALLAWNGDLPGRLMVGMQRARQRGGDGRCSCSSSDPPACGCPPPSFTKSGHIGGVVVARIGDVDDTVCSASGCADGDYFMRLNVAFQPSGAEDPVLQLTDQFIAWRAALVGRPDGVQSTVGFAAGGSPGATTTMTIALLDWQDAPIAVPITSLTVEHGADSAGVAVIGTPVDLGGGVFEVPLTSDGTPGTDRFVITVDDRTRPVVLMPEPTLEHGLTGDLDLDGDIDFADLLALLAMWGPCPDPPMPCLGDLDLSGTVDFADLLVLLAGWTPA